MRYDPERHHRRSVRLRGFDYSSGAFFVTICAHRHACIFGEVYDGSMQLNRAGLAAHEEWLALAQRRSNITLDEFVVMPNHMHAILWLDQEGAVRLQTRRFSHPEAGSLASVIGGFKSGVTRRLRLLPHPPECSWQSGYHDRILRDEDELARARIYVRANPIRWTRDKYHPHNTPPQSL